MTLNATNYSISKSLFEKIANAFKSAVKFIHRRGGYKAEYLKEEEVKPLMEHTYEAFSEAIDFGVKDNVIPPAMKMYLKNNTFIFSGFKTHQQLDRVSRLLHDDDGHVKPFNRFLKDVHSIDRKYNRTYLQAEYNFAVASAQAAGKWHEFAEYADRYYLQYRTAKDERVREEHAILDGITLPMDDPFWDEYYVPLGWNCRCQVVQVSKKRYEPSNPSEALARGRAATYKPNADGVNKAAIFRFNPGKEQRIFPKKHPYFPKGCGDCGLNQYAVGKGKPQCAVCNAFKDINESFNEFRKLSKEYTLTRFDFHSGGYIATHPGHNFVTKIQKIKNKKGDIVYTPKFSSGSIEVIVAGKLCDNGGRVIFQEEKSNNGKTGDIKYKGKTWDIKYCNTDNEESIRKTIKNASLQADNVIFYSDFKEKIIGAIKSAANREKAPIDIYFMEQDGNLIKLKKRE